MARRSNHVVPSSRKGGWAVIKSGSLKASRSFERKEDAVRYGKELSRKEETDLYIHKRDGRIHERNSYTKEPATAKV